MSHPFPLPFGALTTLSRPARARTVVAGEVLAHADATPRTHFVVVTGTLETRRDGRTIASTDAGEVAGALALGANGLLGELVAITDGVVLELPDDHLRTDRPGRLAPTAAAA